MSEARIQSFAEFWPFYVREHSLPAYQRLWDYYRNELDFAAADEHRPYRAAQEQGLPQRLVGAAASAQRTAEVGGGRREVVVENDIAWRLHAKGDFRRSNSQTYTDDPDDSFGQAVLRSLFESLFSGPSGYPNPPGGADVADETMKGILRVLD